MKKDVGKKADYILALKGNQGKLCEDVEVFPWSKSIWVELMIGARN